MSVPNQNDRVVWLCVPTSATNAEVITTSSVDTNGYEDVALDFFANTVGTSFTAAIAVQESDDNTTFASIAALTGGSATSSTVGVLLAASLSAASTKSCYRATIAKRGNRKRYLKCTITPTTTQTWVAVATLSGRTANQAPNSLAERNVQQFANV
ncbi:MAG: hypothetical protein WC718_19040 [Phycisphaerales bacterium]|jgi:hypothetical protein